jgi:DNA-binding beta-propeller fold protein YncE
VSTYDARINRRRLLLLTVLLLLLLAALLFAYNVVLKPPSLRSGIGANEEGYSHRFSLYGFGPERLSRPSDVAIGPDGRIYVVDTFNHRVVVYDERGRYVEHFGEYGTGQFEIEYPSGIAVAPDGTVFVLCKGADKVVIYDSAHQPSWEIRAESPQVATVANGRFYLATYRGIMVGDLDGSLVTAFSRRGREPGHVDHPGGIAVTSDGTIYLADSLNYRVQALDSDGKALWVAGEASQEESGLRNRTRRFGLPVGLTLGDDGLIYLVDAFTGSLIVLDPEDGSERARYGEWGHEDGMFYYPAGIAHGKGDTFAVADKFNDRVQVLQVQSPIEPPVVRLLRSPAAWLLPLALLPLLLLFVRRRYTADRAFLRSVVSKQGLRELSESVPKIGVTAAIKEEFEDVEQGGQQAASLLFAIKGSWRRAEKLAEKHGLDTESAQLLARAKRPVRLPSVLLADDPLLLEAARAEGVTALDSSEVLTYWGFVSVLEPAVAGSTE